MARSLVTGASLLSFPLRASGRNDRILREPATANGPTVLPRQYFRQCPGTRWYGSTKHGKYVGECAAIQDGNRPAYGKACGSDCQSGQTTAPASSPSAEEKTAPAQQAGNPDAKVWVNTNSGVYHCPGTRWYGSTKQGEYMTQKKAREGGYRPAYGKVCQ